MAHVTVAVVGAGIMGASVAFHLAARGVRVYCVERERAACRTTAVSFARLSAFQQPTPTRFGLSYAGIAEYRSFAGRFGSPSWWHPCGSLAWSDDADEPSFRAHLDRLSGWGYRVSWHEAEQVNRRWGDGVAFPHSRARVALLPDEGWVDAPCLVRSLLDAAARTGLLSYHTATAVDVRTEVGRVTGLRLSTGECLPVDALVNASGAAAPQLAAAAGVPMAALATRRSLVADLTIGAAPVRHVLRAPQVHVRCSDTGRVRVRSDQVDGRLPAEPTAEVPPELQDDLLRRASLVVPALASATVERVQIGEAAFPADGLPSAGQVSALDGYYEAVANSGVILAPLLGRLLADQIVDGDTDPLLLPCAPDRLRQCSGADQPGPTVRKKTPEEPTR